MSLPPSNLRSCLLLFIGFTSLVLGQNPRNDGEGRTKVLTSSLSNKLFHGKGDEWAQELLGEKSLAKFPEAKVENAYKEWKPVDGGHPMRDPTLLYAPPSLERVVFQGPFAETERSSRANYEIEKSAGQGRSASSSFHRAIVIKAEPSVRKNDGKYSVYGSPDINYSQYYIDPPKSDPSEDGLLLPEERVSPYEAFQREYFGSAVESRSADQFQKYTGPRVEERSSSRHGGGFQYIDPPNRDSYYYYSDDSPYYKAKLSIHPTELYGSPAPPPPETKEEIGPKRRNYDVIPSDEDDASAVVYTFERENGQRQKVGVIFKRDSLDGPQINKVFSSNKNLVLRNPKNYSPSLRPIPISLDHSPPTLRPNVQEPSHGDLVSGKISHVYHGYKYHKKLPPSSINYPLGNPFAASSVQPRPKFFKPQKSPPIFKIAPHRLEGQFGPAIPKLQGTPKAFSVPRSNRRNDEEPRIVYKTVRDIEYSQPSSIYRVKDSGELYNPSLDTLSAPPGKEARIVLTTKAPWRPDFSDALNNPTTERFSLIPADVAPTTSRPLKFPNSLKPKRNIVRGDKNTQNKPPLVIGFNYDDNPRRLEEFEDFENEFEDSKVAEKSPQELYRLCLKEVPEYLRSVLCPPLLEKEKQSRGIPEVGEKDILKNGDLIQDLDIKNTKRNLKPSVIRSQSKIKVYRPSPSSTTSTNPPSTSTAASTTTTKSQAKEMPETSSHRSFISRLSDLFSSDSQKRIGIKERQKKEPEDKKDLGTESSLIE